MVFGLSRLGKQQGRLGRLYPEEEVSSITVVNVELREDGFFELREDNGIELRE